MAILEVTCGPWRLLAPGRGAGGRFIWWLSGSGRSRGKRIRRLRAPNSALSIARPSSDGGRRYPGRVGRGATASVVDRGKTNLAAFGERSQLRERAG